MRPGIAAALVLACACGGSTATDVENAGTAERDAPANDDGFVPAIAAAMKEREAGVYDCRARATADELDLDGQVVLELAMGNGGSVAEISVVRDSIGDAVLRQCLVALWRDARIDAPFAVGDKISLPPMVFVSEGAQYLVAVDHVPPSPSASGDIKRLKILHEKNTGNDAVAVDMYVVAVGEDLVLEPEPGREGMAYLLSGRGTVAGPERRCRGRLPQARSGAHDLAEGGSVAIAAGSAVRFENRAQTDSVVVLFSPLTVEEHCFGPLTRNPADAEKLPIAKGRGEVALYWDRSVTGSANGYLGRFSAQPGVAIPEHTHDGSSEYLLILSGTGQMTVAGVSFPVKGGDAIQVPPGTRHSFAVSGDQPVVALQVYSPGGPEQRFRQ